MALAMDTIKRGCYWYPVGVFTSAGFEPVLGGPLILDQFFAGGQPRHISTRPVDWTTRPQLRLSRKRTLKEPAVLLRFWSTSHPRRFHDSVFFFQISATGLVLQFWFYQIPGTSGWSMDQRTGETLIWTPNRSCNQCNTAPCHQAKAPPSFFPYTFELLCVNRLFSVKQEPCAGRSRLLVQRRCTYAPFRDQTAENRSDAERASSCKAFNAAHFKCFHFHRQALHKVWSSRGGGQFIMHSFYFYIFLLFKGFKNLENWCRISVESNLDRGLGIRSLLYFGWELGREFLCMFLC